MSKQSRLRIQRHFAQEMGEELASDLMDSLPPQAWADLATKQDLEALGVELRAEMQEGFAAAHRELDHAREVLELRITGGLHEVRAELHESLRVHTLGIVATNISFMGLALAAVKLL